MTSAPATEQVGPVLEDCGISRAVVSAIEELNDGAAVIDRGSYLRVLVPGRCRVTREAIERLLGRPFRLPADLERIMPAFKGRFTVSEEEAVWTAGAP